MASKRRIRRQACSGKVRHATQAAAAMARHVLIQKVGWTGTMNTYRCQFCNGWHVGHASKKFLRK